MSDLLHPPSLARTLREAAARNASSAAAVAEPEADAAATRAALEACEKAAAILKAQLLAAVDSSDVDDAPPPPAKRRAVEREGAVVVAAASSSNRSSDSRSDNSRTADGGADEIDGGAPGTEADAREIKSTKSIHTQQPDGTWSTVVVSCAARAVVVAADRATGYHGAEVNILARMQDEVRQEVLDFAQGQAARDLGRVRIASKAVHEAMMGSDLDLSDLEPQPSVAQLTALTQGATLHKFKQIPVEQHCSCAAGRALSHAGVGSEVSAHGWEAVPDHERLAVGVARSWRFTTLKLCDNDVALQQWRGVFFFFFLGGPVAPARL